MKQFKVLLVGDGCSGKTTFARRHESGDFTNKYIPTIGVEVVPIVFNTNKGKVCLNMWDCAGQDKFAVLRDGYYIGADAAIIMLDLTQKNLKKSYNKWLVDVARVMHQSAGEHLKIVVCGNKADILTKKLPKIDTSPFNYFNISVKSNFNYEKPFVCLLKQLLGDDCCLVGWDEE